MIVTRTSLASLGLTNWTATQSALISLGLAAGISAFATSAYAASSRSNWSVSGETGVQTFIPTNAPTGENQAASHQAAFHVTVWWKQQLGIHLVSGVGFPTLHSLTYGAGAKLRILDLDTSRGVPFISRLSLTATAEVVELVRLTNQLPSNGDVPGWSFRPGLYLGFGLYRDLVRLESGVNVLNSSGVLYAAPAVLLSITF